MRLPECGLVAIPMKVKILLCQGRRFDFLLVENLDFCSTFLPCRLRPVLIIQVSKKCRTSPICFVKEDSKNV